MEVIFISNVSILFVENLSSRLNFLETRLIRITESVSHTLKMGRSLSLYDKLSFTRAYYVIIMSITSRYPICSLYYDIIWYVFRIVYLASCEE